MMHRYRLVLCVLLVSLLLAVCACVCASWASGVSDGQETPQSERYVSPSAGHARRLLIGFSTSSPPYVDRARQGGIEPDLVVRALEVGGFRMLPAFLPHARALEYVATGRLDGCGPVGDRTDVGVLHRSEAYAQYRNIVVSLEADDYEIETVEDLAGLPVTAFHLATVFLGDEFASAVARSPRYDEMVDQGAQVEAFFGRRDRVIVLDERIFTFHRERLARLGELPPVRCHRIFPPQDRFFVFRDVAVRDAFDRGMRALRQSGEYARILR